MGGFLVQITLKKKQKQESYSKRKKSCTKSEKLLVELKVAPNLKSCSKVAEQLMDSLDSPHPLFPNTPQNVRSSPEAFMVICVSGLCVCANLNNYSLHQLLDRKKDNYVMKYKLCLIYMNLNSKGGSKVVLHLS